MKPTPEMIAAFKAAYQSGSCWTDRLTHAIEAMMAIAPKARAALSADGGEQHPEGDVGPLIYEAFASLPEGWEIRLNVENGYGCVTLIDPSGEERSMDDGIDTIKGQVREAIDAAIAANHAKGGAE